LHGQSVGHVSKHSEVFQPDAGSALLLQALTDDKENLQALHPAVCVDLGCGCAGAAIHLTQLLPENSCAVLAMDITAAAMVSAKENARCNEAQVELVRMNLLGGLRPGSVDVIAFHCPYVPSSAQALSEATARADLSASYAGGPDGIGLLIQTVPMMREVLSERGLMYSVCPLPDGHVAGSIPAGSCLSKWVRSAELALAGVVATECAAHSEAAGNLCVLKCSLGDGRDAAPLPDALVTQQHERDGAAVLTTGDDVD
jgi:release factor glutamine methyltransferase